MYGADQKQNFRTKWVWSKIKDDRRSSMYLCELLWKSTERDSYSSSSLDSYKQHFGITSFAILVTVYFKELILPFFSQGKSWTTRKRWWAWHPWKPRTPWPTWPTRAWRSESKHTPETHGNKIQQNSRDISSYNYNQLNCPSSLFWLLYSKCPSIM